MSNNFPEQVAESLYSWNNNPCTDFVISEIEAIRDAYIKAMVSKEDGTIAKSVKACDKILTRIYDFRNKEI